MAVTITENDVVGARMGFDGSEWTVERLGRVDLTGVSKETTKALRPRGDDGELLYWPEAEGD